MNQNAHVLCKILMKFSNVHTAPKRKWKAIPKIYINRGDSSKYEIRQR